MASTAAVLGGTAATLGLPNVVMRFVAEADDDTAKRQAVVAYAFRVSLFGALALCVVFGGTLVAGVSVTGSAWADAGILAGACGSVLASTSIAILSGRRFFDKLLATTIVIQPIAAVCITAVALTTNRPRTVIVTQGVVLLLGGLALGRLTFLRRTRVVPSALHEAARESRTVRRHLIPLSLIDLVVWQRSEIIFLGFVSTHREIAFYGLAFSLVSQVMSRIPGSISGVLLPELASATGNDRKLVFHRSLVMMASVVVPITGLGVAGAGHAVDALYGNQYSPMASVIRILLVGGALSALASPSAALLLASDRQRQLVGIGVPLAVLNIALAATLSGPLGARGAAIASAATQMVGVWFGWRLVKRLLGLTWPRSLATAVTIGSVASGIAWYAGTQVGQPWPALTLTVIVFAIGCCPLAAHLRCPSGFCVRCALRPPSWSQPEDPEQDEL